MTEQEKRENVIKGLECCGYSTFMDKCQECPYDGEDCFKRLKADALALLKAQEPVQPNGEQYQCNKCKFYQGVHNVMGYAPCSFWNIGGVLWNDYCSRFYDFR